ncbi:Bardet-Biedl syndrome 2 protein homolog [Bradysia coprophila]|uniref:Bardet-Biedl syndrome 2 protein homolog n=1 Tax=Bradysia coprophila TaxID=38358 RepID=UPI00187DBC15|nr:Bardet-Biedl syndrome 2 protein homolog [Bradysia coprophila]
MRYHGNSNEAHKNVILIRSEVVIMNFSLNPVFSFRLNQNIVSQLKFGKYDGIHVCLTAATSSDKVIIHSPHKRIGASNNRISWSETNYDVALLNFNQEITAIETGCLKENDSKEILVIGSPTHVLAYNVDDNIDLFYNDVKEGINTILIGMFNKFELPLVVLGCNDNIRCYDYTGKEVFWIVTNGNVNSLTLSDVNKDGRNELIAGTSSGSIMIYDGDALLMEFTENSAVKHICQVDKNSFLAYALIDGTIGVYRESIRLWRIKSKSKGTSLASFDLLGSGKNQLIVGWESGRIDMRDYGTGDILYKLNLNHPIISVGQADYRGNGANDLILCTTTGEVRGYERSKINLNTMKCSDQEELLELLTQKKVLLAEISHYECNEKLNREKQNDYDDKFVAPEGVGVIPSNTRLQIAIYNNIEGDVEPNIEIKIITNNSTVIRAVLLFSEGIFESETFIAYPEDRAVSRIIIPFKIPKDNCYDVNIKALVGHENSQQFHVFELTRQLPKFSMYAIREDFLCAEKMSEIELDDTSFVEFRINERFQRICLWINQNFLLSNDIEPEALDDTGDIKLYMVSLYDQSNILMRFYDGNQIKIVTPNIHLAGSFIQSLAKFMNMDNLQTQASYPQIEEEISTLFRKIDGLQISYQNLTLDMTQKKNLQKNLIVRIEDARLYNQDALLGLYADMQKLTEDLLNSHMIRQKNFEEIQKSLQGVNSILKAASKLRVGSFAINMMQHLKDAVKTKNIEAINKIIAHGVN